MRRSSRSLNGMLAILAAGLFAVVGCSPETVTATRTIIPAADEPMFQTGTDESLFTENFESFSNLTALLTYNSALSRYTYNGQQYLNFPSPSGAHTGANAFRNTYPVQSTYLDVGGFINAERVPGAPTTRPQFMVIEFWLRTSPGYPWRRQGASDQQGAGEKTLVWNASNTSVEPRFVLEPGLAPCCKGQWWGGKYDAAFPTSGSGVGIVMALDGSSVSGGAMWYFQNMNAATRSPVGYMNDGNWHLWKIKLTPSTVQTGSSGDGAIEMWVDGVKVLEYIGTDPSRPEYSKVLVPTTVAAAFDSFGMGGPFNGGPSPAQGPQWKDYDDVRIWYRP